MKLRKLLAEAAAATFTLLGANAMAKSNPQSDNDKYPSITEIVNNDSRAERLIDLVSCILRYFEGQYDYAYLCSAGKLTCGDGICQTNGRFDELILIKTDANGNERIATATEKKRYYQAVKNAQHKKFSGYGSKMNYYKRLANEHRIRVDLDQSAVVKHKILYDNYLLLKNNFKKEHRIDFDKLPLVAQIAFLELSFQIGNKVLLYNNFRTAARDGRWFDIYKNREMHLGVDRRALENNEWNPDKVKSGNIARRNFREALHYAMKSLSEGSTKSYLGVKDLVPKKFQPILLTALKRDILIEQHKQRHQNQQKGR